MKHLSDLRTEMKHLCTVNRTDNTKPDNAEAEDGLSRQTNQTPPQIDKRPYFLRSKRISEEARVELADGGDDVKYSS